VDAGDGLLGVLGATSYSILPFFSGMARCGLPDPLVVFHPLKRDELGEVLELELGLVQKRVLESTTRPFLFRVTTEGRQFLLEEGTDQRYGARQ
jgi:ATP-dependent Clp protease ATP-binding subunit ClpA